MISDQEDQAWGWLHGWLDELWHLEDPAQEIHDLQWDQNRLAAAIFLHILEDRRLSRSAFSYGQYPSKWRPRRHDWQLWLVLKDYSPEFLTQALIRSGHAPFYLTQGLPERSGR